MDSLLENHLLQVGEKWKLKLSNKRQLKIAMSATAKLQTGTFVRLVVQWFLHKASQMNVRSYLHLRLICKGCTSTRQNCVYLKKQNP